MTTGSQNAQDSLDRSGSRILIVDDEAMILQVFSRIVALRLPQCQIDVAPNGKEAVESYKSLRPDLIVMDLHMPVMDGKTAFLEIQQHCQAEKLRMPPILFVTGFAPPNELTSMIGQNSQHAILRKPITAEMLIAAIKVRLPS